MNITLTPGGLHACTIRVPSSKSIGHRALIAASLASGVSQLRGFSFNEDTDATMNALRMLGARFEKSGDSVFIYGTEGNPVYDGSVIDCRESGSTLRFLIPLLTRGKQTARFKGQGRLMERPLSVYEDIYASQNLRFEIRDGILHAEGPLKPGAFCVDGSISSQFVSGLLFALPLCEEDSVIEIGEPFESSSYVRLTTDVLEAAGIQIETEGLRIQIRGRQKFKPFVMDSQADDSQAAVFAALAMMADIPVTIPDMAHDSRQGDHAVIEIIRNCGGTVKEETAGYTFIGGRLHAIQADLSGCPDLGPVLFALAAAAEGRSVFRNTARLRLKESDRIEAMIQEMTKLGCRIHAEGNTVAIEGPAVIKGNVIVDGHHDHRVIMALSVLAARADGPVTIAGCEAVAKSWPDFFERLSETGMKVSPNPQ